MFIYTYILDILKLTLAGVGVVYVAFYLAKPYLDNKEKFQLLEHKRHASNHTLPLRLQGYERIVLLIDRINPSNLLVRLNSTAYTAAELQSLIISEVRNEFQHNVTQQVYVSSHSWQVVKRIKEDTLKLVNSAARALPADSSGLELGRAILSHLSQMETDPYDGAINLIRADLEELF